MSCCLLQQKVVFPLMIKSAQPQAYGLMVITNGNSKYYPEG